MTTQQRPPGTADAELRFSGRLRRIGALVTAAFGLVWALTGATALAARVPVLIASAVLSAVCVVVASRPRVAPRPRRLPDRWSARYNAIGIVQGVTIALVVAAAVALGTPGLIAPVVCLVVGLHFLPLAAAVDQPGYRLTGAALVLAGLAGTVVLVAAGAQAAQATSGLAAAVVLWVTSCAVASRP
jgi:hypothetical protein